MIMATTTGGSCHEFIINNLKLSAWWLDMTINLSYFIYARKHYDYAAWSIFMQSSIQDTGSKSGFGWSLFNKLPRISSILFSAFCLFFSLVLSVWMIIFLWNYQLDWSNHRLWCLFTLSWEINSILFFSRSRYLKKMEWPRRMQTFQEKWIEVLLINGGVANMVTNNWDIARQPSAKHLRWGVIVSFICSKDLIWNFLMGLSK